MCDWSPVPGQPSSPDSSADGHLQGMERRALTADELVGLTHGLPAWSEENGWLVRTVDAGTFPLAIAWVVTVADVAEAMGHHPDIDIRYRRVTFRIRTHDLDALTTWDVALAHRIDQIIDSPATAER